jgi:hypothetical protein
MKTLVIHPEDKTTDFLKVIYAGKEWSIIDYRADRKEITKAILEHDRIVMLGHGSAQGLFGYNDMVIDSSLVYLLKGKQCVCIWCNADKFVDKYKLQGFYTGMIISEWQEAIDYAILPQGEDIEESNALFASTIASSIDSPTLLTEVKEIYKSETNPVILFNQENIYST